MQADNFYPVKFDSSTSYVKDSDTADLGAPCPLSDIEEWAELEGEINLMGLEKTLFSYFKMPIANNRDSKSRLGVKELYKDFSKKVGLRQKLERSSVYGYNWSISGKGVWAEKNLKKKLIPCMILVVLKLMLMLI